MFWNFISHRGVASEVTATRRLDKGLEVPETIFFMGSRENKRQLQLIIGVVIPVIPASNFCEMYCLGAEATTHEQKYYCFQ